MRIRVLALAGLIVGLAFATGLGGKRSPGLRDGEVLGPENWQAARGFLPDEILEHYRLGEYQNQFIDLSLPRRRPLAPSPEYEQATRANRGRFALDEAGSIVDAQTGKPPEHIVGSPFPDIDPSDPKAGVKAVWNHIYANYYRGDYHYRTDLTLLGRQGIERRITTDILQRLYDGSPESAGRPNPDDLLAQQLARVVSPAELHGTTTLTWRHRAGERNDSIWTYVPGLRRPREVNPLNRSDGFLGSEITLDDGPFFDGKPESFTFRLLGRQDMLVLVDPSSVRGEGKVVALESGGWRRLWQEVPRLGADKPGWTGVPWAPVSAALALRPVWIVEAVPRDRNYLYGRIVLRFDGDTFLGTWASKYDRAGTLLMSYQISSNIYDSPDGGHTWLPVGGMVVQTAENVPAKRATALLFPTRDPSNPADQRIPTDPSSFDLNALARLGK